MRHPLFPLGKGPVVSSHKHSAETPITHQFRGNKGRVGVCLRGLGARPAALVDSRNALFLDRTSRTEVLLRRLSKQER